MLLNEGKHHRRSLRTKQWEHSDLGSLRWAHSLPMLFYNGGFVHCLQYFSVLPFKGCLTENEEGVN